MQKIVDTIINKQIEEKMLKTEDIKIYRYGYILLGEVLLNLIIAVVIGLIFDELKIISFFLFIYIPLRSFCGGWHADKIWKCTIISNIMLLLQIWGKRFLMHNVAIYILMGLFLLSLISILYLAPVETKSKKISVSERHTYKKRIYCIMLFHAVVFAALILTDTQEYVFSMGYAYVVQNIMLVLEVLKNKLCVVKNKL